MTNRFDHFDLHVISTRAAGERLDSWRDNLVMDARYAWRGLRRSPVFAAVTIATLALGIGANTAIFSVISATLIEPLKLGAPDRIGRLVPQHPEYGESDLTFALADLADLQRQSQTLEQIAAYDGWRTTIDTPDGAEEVDGAIVSPNYFSVLGIQPAVGRFFAPTNEGFSEEPAVVLSHTLWQQRFGGDSALIGEHVRLSGLEIQVVGVAPADIENVALARGTTKQPELWRSATTGWASGDRAARGYRSVTALARVRRGVSIERANAEVQAIFARLAQAYPTENDRWSARLIPLKDHLVAPVRPALMTLLAAAGLVLLIACANVANLVLSRMNTRAREVAIRTALGAPSGRIVRQIMMETVALAVAGAAAGVLLAAAATRVLVNMGGVELPRANEISLDWGTLLFTLIVALLTGVVLGLVASARAFDLTVQPALRDTDPRATGAHQHRRWRWTLIATETALAVTLLTGAALLIQSLRNLYAVDAGLRVTGVSTARVQVAGSGYDSEALVRQAYDRITTALGSEPGVTAVGLVNILPMSGGYWRTDFLHEGRPLAPDEQGPSAEIRTVSPGLFNALGISVLAGRPFEAHDAVGASPVAIVNQVLAAEQWPGETPVGKRIVVFDEPREIVGMVNDVREFALDRAAEGALYVPIAQSPAWLTGSSYLVVRAERGELPPSTIQRVVRTVDRGIPVSEVASMGAIIDRTTAPQRFRTMLLGLFGILALVLAGLGIHSVVAYSVAQRTREIGIRLALGAQVSRVLVLLVRQEMRPIVIGLALGIAAALAGGRLLAGFLYGVEPTDPSTIIGVVLLLAAVALASTVIPSLRTARLDVVTTLRKE